MSTAGSRHAWCASAMVAYSAATLCLCSMTPLHAQEWETDFDAARTKALGSGQSLLVVLTGSDWNPASKVIDADHLRSKRLLDALPPQQVRVHVDLRIRPKGDADLTARDAAVAVFNALAVWRHDQLPCAVLLDAAGRERARSYLPAGNVDSTIKIVREMLDAAAQAGGEILDPRNAIDQVAKARALVQQGKLREARAIAVEAAHDDPTNPEAWDLCARTAEMFASAFRVREARSSIAVTVMPQQDPAPALVIAGLRWNVLGRALANQKRDTEALFCFRHSMSLDRQGWEGGLEAARISLRTRDLAGALRDADEVLRRDFGNVEALQIRAKCLPAKTLEGR